MRVQVCMLVEWDMFEDHIEFVSVRLIRHLRGDVHTSSANGCERAVLTGLPKALCASIAPVAQAAARRGTAWGTRADGQYALQRAWQRGALGCKVQ